MVNKFLCYTPLWPLLCTRPDVSGGALIGFREQETDVEGNKTVGGITSGNSNHETAA